MQNSAKDVFIENQLSIPVGSIPKFSNSRE